MSQRVSPIICGFGPSYPQDIEYFGIFAPRSSYLKKDTQISLAMAARSFMRDELNLKTGQPRDPN